MSITILKPGIYSSIQDLGRWGHQQYGIPISGAMDEFSARLANIICGNDEQDALVELTLHGTEIMFNESACISITGSGSRIFINDLEVEFNRLIKLEAFSILKFKPAAKGCRAYLAVQGGLNIKKELGSASTYSPSSIGGINGHSLNTGDIIPFSRKVAAHSKSNDIKQIKNGFGVSAWIAAAPINKQLGDPHEIKICLGPEWELFSEESKNKLLKTEYTISLKANRMGIHLEGEILALDEKKEMISSAVTRGVIQVTNKGLPIILMADAQTTGGYPRIARVCSADLSILAQCRPGDRLIFLNISENESFHKMKKMKEILKSIEIGLANK